MVYPIPGIPITTPYGKPGTRWKAGHHQGVDFAAPSGTPYAAVADGIVIATGSAWGANLGDQQIVIDHQVDGQDYYTVYAHGNTETVQVGDRVTAGQIIGTIGARGNTTGPHLHLEAHTVPAWDTVSDVNPAPLLAYNGGMSGTPGTATLSGHALHTAGYTQPVIKTTQVSTYQAQTAYDATQVFNPLGDTSRLIRILTDGQFWIRVLEIAGGAALIIWGVTIITAGNVGLNPAVLKNLAPKAI